MNLVIRSKSLSATGRLCFARCCLSQQIKLGRGQNLGKRASEWQTRRPPPVEELCIIPERNSSNP